MLLGVGKRSLDASHLDERAMTFLDDLLRLGRSPSGKAEACKASIRRFDSDPPLFEDCALRRGRGSTMSVNVERLEFGP